MVSTYQIRKISAKETVKQIASTIDNNQSQPTRWLFLFLLPSRQGGLGGGFWDYAGKNSPR